MCPRAKPLGRWLNVLLQQFVLIFPERKQNNKLCCYRRLFARALELLCAVYTDTVSKDTTDGL